MISIYLLGEIWHVDSSILALRKEACLPIVAMPKQVTESLAEASAV